jgi:hypothetical protein
MRCYECAKQGADAPAVALCKGCSAGLCLTHLRETVMVFQSGAIRVSCHHDTWGAEVGVRTPAVPARTDV